MVLCTAPARRAISVLLGVVAVLVLAPALAGASTVTVGPPTVSNLGSGIASSNATFVQTAVSGGLTTAPVDGVVTQWRVQGTKLGSTGQVALRVLRAGGGGTFTGAGTSAAASALDGTALATSLPIQVGDYIGLNATGSGGDAGAVDRMAGIDEYAMFSPVLGDGSSGAPTSSNNTGQLQFNADITPAVPVVTGVSPSSGSGGDSVTISGQHLAEASSVTFGSAQAGILSNSNSQIVAVAPAHAPGTVDVTVTAPGGTSATSSSDQFTYLASGSGGGSSGGGPSGSVPPPVSAVIPTLSGLAQSHPVFRVGAATTPLVGQTARSVPRGTTFSFRLDEPAALTLRIQRKLPGRRVGSRCKRPTQRLRNRPTCTRLVTKTTLSRSGHAGLNKLAFTGRIRAHALAPGRYRASFTAATSAGSSAPRALNFRIVR